MAVICTVLSMMCCLQCAVCNVLCAVWLARCDMLSAAMRARCYPTPRTSKHLGPPTMIQIVPTIIIMGALFARADEFHTTGKYHIHSDVCSVSQHTTHALRGNPKV